MDEQWLPVVGYEGYYEVSDWGNVRSLPRQGTLYNGGTRWYGGKLLALSNSGNNGYLRVHLSRKNKTRHHLVHHLVMFAFIGPRPFKGADILHEDDNKTNNHLSNLRYDTHSANEREKVQHGRHPQSKKESCPQGHPYTPENTRIQMRPSGPCRFCRTCARIKARQYYYQRKAKAGTLPPELDSMGYSLKRKDLKMKERESLEEEASMEEAGMKTATQIAEGFKREERKRAHSLREKAYAEGAQSVISVIEGMLTARDVDDADLIQAITIWVKEMKNDASQAQA